MALDDIMLFNIANRQWTAVCQMGCRPEGRWNGAIEYCEDTQALYIYGGGSYNGMCRSECFVATFDAQKIQDFKLEYKAAINEVKRGQRVRR